MKSSLLLLLVVEEGREGGAKETDPFPSHEADAAAPASGLGLDKNEREDGPGTRREGVGEERRGLERIEKDEGLRWC
jgi:hypothetical protein